MDGVVVAIFVLDTQGKALMPCTEKRAQLLLARGRARVHRLVPTLIRLVDRSAHSCTSQPLRLKLDSGSTEKKAEFSIEYFPAKYPTRLKKVLANTKKPLPDAVAVNAARWALANALKATGRCSYQSTQLNQFSYSSGRGYLLRSKTVQGFGTSNKAQVDVPCCVKFSIHTGQVVVRLSDPFNIKNHQDGKAAMVQGISQKYCREIRRSDGYSYFFNQTNDTGRKKTRPSTTKASRLFRSTAPR